MMNRYALLLTAALGMAAAQTAPAPLVAQQAAVSKAQKDPKLSGAPVSINTGSYRGPLSIMLAALAKSAKYEVVFNFNVDALALIDGSTGAPAATPAGAPADAPSYASATGKPQELSAKPIVYSFINRPFNEVWPLLMDVYELQYEVVRIGSGEIIRVGQRPAQLAVPLAHITAKYAEQKALEFFGKPSYSELPIYDNTGKIVDKVRQFDRYVLDSSTMKILADIENNRLIAGGTAEETAKIRSFVATIDIPKQSNPATPRGQVIYNTKSSPADVNNVLKSQFPDLQVTPVGQSSQLILTGPQPLVDAALKLLAQVDRPATAISSPDSQTQVYAARGNPEDVVKFLAAQYPGLKVTPLGTTERLVISGPQDQLKTALTLLSQVDQTTPIAASTVQKVFTLVNASAEEVKATLEGTLARDVTPAAPNLVNVPVNATDANGNAISVTVPAPKPDPAVTAATDAAQRAAAAATAAQNTGGANIIADTRTNTLIVRGTQAQVNQIAELIPQLDQVVPQINVQVRIQEISETAARSLGVDWKLGLGGFNVSLGGGGLAASFDPTRSLVGFNLGPTLKTLESQGMTKSVYDGSVTMQSGQRSLGGSGNTQNASNTAAASIKSGGRLELNIPSTAGNIEKQIDYGVNLDFFNPQVAPDGSITMRVRGQVNDLLSPLPTNSLPAVLQFANSEAQSLITFKSGQTVLLSGLLSTKESNTKTGVPFLSSLPVIGAAFGEQKVNKTQTQLLVVITGNIVK